MKFKVMYMSNYNGVSIEPVWDNISEEDTPYVDDAIDKISDEVDDTLPSYTYECAKDDWDHQLSKEQEVELRRRALAIVNKYLPEVTLDDVSYEEDCYSS